MEADRASYSQYPDTTNFSLGRVTPLSCEQFLYSLSRTPTPTRFGRRRFHLQIPSDLCRPLQVSENGDGNTTALHRAGTRDVGDSTTNQEESDKTLGKASVAETVQSPKKDGNKNEEVMRKEAILEEAESDSQELTLEGMIKIARLATKKSTQTNTNSTNKKLKNMISNTCGHGESSSTILLPLGASEASAKYDLPSDNGISGDTTKRSLCDDSKGPSHNFSGEESSYDKKSGDGVFMIENDEHHPEASHLTSVESTAQVQYPPSVQKRQSLFVDDDFIAAWENRVLSGPSRTKLKRPTRAHPRNVAQDLSLLTTNECRVQKKTRRPRCAPVDELELAQERIPSRDDSASEKSTLDYDPVIESSQEILETPRLNIHHAAFSGRHSQIPNKVLAKSSSKRKRQHSAICLKDFKFPERPTVQQLSTKRFQSRLDFCDGFVGREAQPTGHTVPAPRSRQQLGPRNIRRPMGYIGQLTLVRSRTFVDETSVQEEQGDNLSTPNRDHSNKKERRVILAEKPNAQREEVASKNIVMEAGRENLSSDAANRHQKPGQIAIKGNRGPQELKGKDAMEIVWPDSTTPDNSRAENLDGVACMEDDGFVHHDESVQQNRESDQSSDIPAEIARSNCNFLPTVDDVEMDEPRSRLSTEFGNDSTLSIKVESIGISNPPPVNKLKRRVTFSEPLETVRQQLTMVSAPAPMQSIDPDTESEYDSTDAEDSSEKTDSDSFEDDSEDDSSMHEQTPESPARNSATNSNLPFTPIRQRLRVHSGSSEEMLQSGTVESYERLAQGDEIILDDGVNTICGNYEVADSQSPCETNYDGEMLRWSPEAPWKPRRPVYTGRNIEVDEEIYDDSPSEEDPETEDGMMHGGTFGKGLTTHQRLMLSNQTFTPAGFPKRHRREPSIELGNDNWPPRSRYSPTIPDSRTPRMQELDSQFQRIAVTDIPTYFSTASQMLSQPLRGPATSMTRSKTMPLQSQYFKEDEEDDDLNAWPDFSLDKVFTGKRKFSPGTGDHDGGNVKLKALTRHVSMASGTMGERRKTPLLPFRPPFKKF